MLILASECKQIHTAELWDCPMWCLRITWLTLFTGSLTSHAYNIVTRKSSCGCGSTSQRVSPTTCSWTWRRRCGSELSRRPSWTPSPKTVRHHHNEHLRQNKGLQQWSLQNNVHFLWIMAIFTLDYVYLTFLHLCARKKGKLAHSI